MSTPSTPATATLAMVTIDCQDPRSEAAFWSALLGWEQTYGDDDYAMLKGPANALGFGRVPGYTAPPWPNEGGTKQFHLDLAVDDIAATEARCLQLGAKAPEHQPGGDRWRVLLDPAGHPFCLTNAANWG